MAFKCSLIHLEPTRKDSNKMTINYKEKGERTTELLEVEGTM